MQTDQQQTRPPNANQPLIDTLEQEIQSVNPEITPTVYALVESELFKLRGGVTDSIDLLGGGRVKVRAKVQIPQDGTNNNYVGRLLGPRGETLKTLQTNTMTKMAILGQGSMRDSQKESEFLASGDPKYQHLKQILHLQVDSLAEASEAYYRMSHALAEVKKTILEASASQGGGQGWGQQQANPGFGGPPMSRGGGPGRGRGGPPPGGPMPQYSAPGYDGSANGSFGSGYGNEGPGGKMPPMRGRGGGRGMPSRPYTRGRGGRP